MMRFIFSPSPTHWPCWHITGVYTSILHCHHLLIDHADTLQGCIPRYFTVITYSLTMLTHYRGVYLDTSLSSPTHWPCWHITGVYTSILHCHHLLIDHADTLQGCIPRYFTVITYSLTMLTHYRGVYLDTSLSSANAGSVQELLRIGWHVVSAELVPLMCWGDKHVVSGWLGSISILTWLDLINMFSVHPQRLSICWVCTLCHIRKYMLWWCNFIHQYVYIYICIYPPPPLVITIYSPPCRHAGSRVRLFDLQVTTIINCSDNINILTTRTQLSDVFSVQKIGSEISLFYLPVSLES